MNELPEAARTPLTGDLPKDLRKGEYQKGQLPRVREAKREGLPDPRTDAPPEVPDDINKHA